MNAIENDRPGAVVSARSPSAGVVERAIERILRDVCELPDRSSPEDQPEMMLVTPDELDMLLRRHLGLEDAALSAPASPAVDIDVLVHLLRDCERPPNLDKLMQDAADELERLSTAPASPAAGEEVRKRFEAWAKVRGLPIHTVHPHDTRYSHAPTIAAWDAWQAAEAPASPAAGSAEVIAAPGRCATESVLSAVRNVRALQSKGGGEAFVGPLLDVVEKYLIGVLSTPAAPPQERAARGEVDHSPSPAQIGAWIAEELAEARGSTPPPRPDERGVLVDHPDEANYDGQVPQQDEGDGA